MKITDLKYTVLEGYPTIRIATDTGIYGIAQVEFFKPYLQPVFIFLKDRIIDQDPTNVEHCMLRIRRLGSFKPWGSAVSAIEIALWDIAGKAAGVPVYKLLGGKIRDRVRVYCTDHVLMPPDGSHGAPNYEPEDYARDARQRMTELPEGFTIMKFGLGMDMIHSVPGGVYGDPVEAVKGPHTFRPGRGHLTERGLKHLIACVAAVKDAVGDKIGVAFDCGPRMSLISATKFAKAVEPYDVMWLEDILTGDYTPYNAVEAYHMLSSSTTTPISTGEQVYLRQGFQELIERHAVDIVGPDPCDVGGLAELKWIAEFADLHDVLIAPHGVGDGPVGIAALTQVCATLPQNYLAFELPLLHPNLNSRARKELQYVPSSEKLVEGLPTPLARDSLMEVSDRPGLGVWLNDPAVRKYLGPESNFLD